MVPEGRGRRQRPAPRGPSLTRVDIAVIGGGPAGAAAALTLLRHSELRVALIERSGYEAWRAGETLSPGARPLLEYLGVWEGFLADGHGEARAVLAAWGGEQVTAGDFLFSPMGPGWHLDRRRFDASLTAAVAQADGVVMTGAPLGRLRRDADEGWHLEVAGADLRARALIDATGRRAVVARRHGVRVERDDQLVGVVALYERTGGERTTLVEAAPHGWWYAAPLPGERLVVAYMSDADLVRTADLRRPDAFAASVASTRQLRERLGGARLRVPPVIRPAFSQRLVRTTGDGWAAAGEAAAAFDPLASMGIGYALASGAQAARALHRLLQSGRPDASEAYGADVARHYAHYRARRAAMYGLERRWPESTFWRRRTGAGEQSPVPTHR